VVAESEAWISTWTETEVSRQPEGVRAAERLGERERAIRGYQFVAHGWRHADPELQPFVTEARSALHRLRGRADILRRPV
jgi:hypothetical protein